MSSNNKRIPTRNKPVEASSSLAVTLGDSLKSYADSVMAAIETEKEALKVEWAAVQKAKEEVEKAREDWKHVAIHLEATQLADPILLNVGGTTFATSKETLTKVEGTYFSGLLSGRWELKRSTVDGSIFIDRDPTLFGYIINYLRDTPEQFQKRLAALTEEEIAILRLESEFYVVQGLCDVLPKPSPFSWQSLAVRISVEPRRKLYQASVDGANHDALSKRCDGQGPVVILAFSSDGSMVIGAYRWKSMSTSEHRGSCDDKKAFLFVSRRTNDATDRESRFRVFERQRGQKCAVWNGNDTRRPSESSVALSVGDDFKIVWGSSIRLHSKSQAFSALGIPGRTTLSDFEIWALG